jgi:hypothetical protein
MSTLPASISQLSSAAEIAAPALVCTGVFVVGKAALNVLYKGGAWIASTTTAKRAGRTFSSVGSMFGFKRRSLPTSKLPPQERAKQVALSAKLTNPYSTAPALETDPKKLVEQTVQLAKEAANSSTSSADAAKADAQAAEKELEGAYADEDAEEIRSEETLSKLPFTDFFLSPTEKQEMQNTLNMMAARETAAAARVKRAEERTTSTTVNAQLTSAKHSITLSTLVKGMSGLSVALRNITQSFLNTVNEKRRLIDQLEKLEKSGSKDAKACEQNIEKLEELQKQEYEKLCEIFDSVVECQKLVAQIQTQYTTGAYGVASVNHEVIRNGELARTFEQLTTAAAELKYVSDIAIATDAAKAAEKRVQAPTIAPNWIHKHFIHPYREWRSEKMQKRAEALTANAVDALTHGQLIKDPTKLQDFQTKRQNTIAAATPFKQLCDVRFKYAESQSDKVFELRNRTHNRKIAFNPILERSWSLSRAAKQEKEIMDEISTLLDEFETAKGYADPAEKGNQIRKKIEELRKAIDETENAWIDYLTIRAKSGFALTQTELDGMRLNLQSLTTRLTTLEDNLPRIGITKPVMDLTFRPHPDKGPGIFSRIWSATKVAFGAEDDPVYQRRTLPSVA